MESAMTVGASFGALKSVVEEFRRVKSAIGEALSAEFPDGNGRRMEFSDQDAHADSCQVEIAFEYEYEVGMGLGGYPIHGQHRARFVYRVYPMMSVVACVLSSAELYDLHYSDAVRFQKLLAEHGFVTKPLCEFRRISQLNRAARMLAADFEGSKQRVWLLLQKNPENDLLEALVLGVQDRSDLDEARDALLAHEERRFWLAGVALRDAYG